MKYQFCEKCGGETVHESRVFNKQERQEQIVWCGKCHNVISEKSVPIYPDDERMMRKRQF